MQGSKKRRKGKDEVESRRRTAKESTTHAGVFALRNTSSPELDVHVLALAGLVGALSLLGRLGHGHGHAVKVVLQWDAREVEQGWHDVGVRRGQLPVLARGDAWAPDHEGHVDVFLDGARLAGGQSVLPDVEPIVRRVDQVRVGQHLGGRRAQPRYNAVHQLVHRLQRLDAPPVVVVVVVDNGLVLALQRLDPATAGCLVARVLSASSAH